MKKILITGAAGFIGSNLAKQLLAGGMQVIGIDNLSHGLLRNLISIKKNRNFQFVKSDCRNAQTVKSLIKKVDLAVHLAAYKIPRYSSRTDTLLVNIDATRTVLESSARFGSGIVAIASTSDVYGKNPKLPFSEEKSDSVIGTSSIARWSYAVSKLFDEHLAFGMLEDQKIKPIIFRFFGAYGPNENRTWWGGPQAVFIEKALRGLPIEIHGDGLQTRTFCYIDDLIRGIELAINNSDSYGKIINLGGDQEISIIKLAKLVWNLVKPSEKIKMKFIPYKNFTQGYEDVRRRVPDLSRAEKLLGYRPEVALEDGLKLTIKWHSKFL